MKHHIVAKFINDLKLVAIKYKDHQCLREQIRKVVQKYVNITIDSDKSMMSEWLVNDKEVLAEALIEIRANRGKDLCITKICDEALGKAYVS